MVVLDYFDSLVEGIEYLIALGSIIGLLGVIVSLIFLLWGGPRYRGHMSGVLIVSFILLTVCGLSTGLEYLRIFR